MFSRITFLLLVLSIWPCQVSAEDRLFYSIGWGGTFYVEELGYGSAEWETPKVFRLGIWSPTQKYLFSGTLIPDNRRKDEKVPTTAYFSAQRVFHWRRWAPYVPYYGLGVSLGTRTTPIQGSLGNFINSLGVKFAPEDKNWFWELSYHHWSNAGLEKPNFGVEVIAVQFSWMR